MPNQEWRSKGRQRFGSIKVIKGNIYARIQYLDEVTGKRKEKLRRAKDRRHARELLHSMQQEMKVSGATSLEADNLKFRDVAKKYESIHIVPAVYQNGVKVAGKRSVGPTLSSLKPLLEHFAGKKIRAIKPSDLEAYKMKRLSTPVEIVVNEKVYDNRDRAVRKIKVTQQRSRKIASVNRELELMRAIFNFAKGEEVVIRSPFENRSRIIAGAAEVQRDRVMSHDEESRLLETCVGKKTHLRPLLILAVDTAMRRGELFKMRWSDVDFLQREIKVQAANAKTEKSRAVGLTQRSFEELTRLWENSDKNPSTLVFGIVSTIKNAWKSACVEASIDDLRFHDLRHTATTRLIRSGVPASEVMKLTGHTQTKTFLRYLNLTNESVANSASMLDRYLTSQRPESTGSERVN